MPRHLSIIEPHPSVPQSGSHYIGGGRGGAGNFKRYDAKDVSSGQNAVGPASLINLMKPSVKRPTVLTGRGGAGNMFKPSQPEEGMFQFDEELVRRREPQAPVYHIGRGGAANFVDESKPRTSRMGSTDSNGSAASDVSSTHSVRRSMEGAFKKFSRRISAD